jgi:crotonobetainyl-CoA:carnitine CoA-transferase CaiB-like acyl-CoA transferase
VTPLAGCRVLDFTRLLPGAYATLLLADLGADVVKIEDPRGGDSMRTLSTAGGAPYFARLNRNKRSLTLDLKAKDAASVLDALLQTADVTVESFRPSTARRLGVDAAALRATRPRLICASISGFDRRGPRADAAGHDINYQALAGLLRPPDPPGALVGDIAAATETALAILAALVARGRSGVGQTIDVSIQGAAESWAIFPTTRELYGPSYALYETADGEWLALGALEEKFWRGFCEGIGRPDFVERRRAEGPAGERLMDDVRAVLRTRTRAEWVARFAEADACLTPVEEARAPAEEETAAPALGADTEAILLDAGIDVDRQKALRRAGVI